MAEPQPGAPGGSASSSGPRSATAATFQVNDASLRQLRATWQGLTKDVQNFNKAVGDLKRHEADLKRLGELTGQLQVGGAGGAGGAAAGGDGMDWARNTIAKQDPARAARAQAVDPIPLPGMGGRAPGMPSVPEPPAPAAGPAGSGGLPRGGGGGGGGGGGRGFGWRVPLAVVGGAAAYAGSRMDGFSDNDLLYNYLGRATGGGYSQGERRTEQRAVLGAGGFQSMGDLNQGVTTATRALGGTAATGRGATLLRQAGQLTALNPDMGLGGASQAASSLYSGTSASRLQAMTGQSSLGPGGRAQSPTQVYDSVLRAVFGGRPFTARQITEGMVPGAPLQRSLDYLLPDPGAQEQFRQYALTRANLGGSSAAANTAINATAKLNAGGHVSKADQRLIDQAGLRDNVRSHQNRNSAQTVTNQTRLGEAARGGIERGFDTLADATDKVTSGFLKLNGAMGGAPANTLGFTSVLSGPVGSAIGAAGGIFGLQGLASVFGIGGGRRRGRGHGGGGGGAGSGGSSGGSGDDTRVFVTNWPDCICSGGSGGGGGGGGIDIPGLGGMAKGGRLGRLGGMARPALGQAGRMLPVIGAAAAADYGIHKGREYLKNRWGHGYDNSNWHWQDAAQGAAESLQYGAAGAALGARFGAPGALVGGTVGTVFGAGKAIWDWGHNTKGYSRRDNAHAPTPGAPADAPPKYGYFSQYATDNAVPRMSKGGQVAGQHTNDNVPIMATPGEVVVPLPVVSRHGGAKRLMKMLGIDGVVLGGASDTRHFAKGGVIGEAEKYLGQPYLWGGNKPDRFDCSGLVQWSYGKNGVKLPRTAAEQQKVGTAVDPKDVQPGDLMFLGNPAHHVMMSLGGGRVIHAPHTGTVVKEVPWDPAKVTNIKRVSGGGAGAGGAATSTGMPTPGDSKGSSGDVGDLPGTPNISPRGFSFSSELDALSGILFGGGMGAAVKSQSSVHGAAAPTPDVASNQPTGPAPKGNLGGWLKSALGILHLDFDRYSPGIASLIRHESGGNPNAVNNWDSNAKAGHPSKGLMQTIDSTFKQWAIPGHNANIFDPVSNIIAGVRYARSRYGDGMLLGGGRKDSKGGYKGYAVGTWQTEDELAQLHAGEMVIPRRTANKVRAMIQQNQRVAVDAPTSGGAGRVHRSVTLSITAPVTVVGKATPDDARSFLEMVKHEAETNKTLDMIGAGG